MFAGHIGAALALSRAERRINVGVFVFAAVLLDILLWLFVLAGWESVTIPANFGTCHQAEFDFPWSHGLMASVAWSALAGVTTFVCYRRLSDRRLRCAFLIATAVISHWLLDALVHVSELPLARAGSTKVGLGLWQCMPVALSVEGILLACGLWMSVSAANLSRVRKLGLSIFCILLLVFTVVGMTVAPPPPSAAAMAGSSRATLIIACVLASWLGRSSPEKGTQADQQL